MPNTNDAPSSEPVPLSQKDEPSSKSADNPSEPVTDHDQVAKTAGHGGTAAASVPKKLGNKNALLHGVYSRDFILPWESEDDFETLHKEFRDEWKPNGRSE